MKIEMWSIQQEWDKLSDEEAASEIRKLTDEAIAFMLQVEVEG